MTGIVRRVAPGYPVPVVLEFSASVDNGESGTIALPSGPGEFLGFAIWSIGNTSLAFNAMKCRIISDGVTVFNDFLYDLLMIPTGTLTKGQFAAHARNLDGDCRGSFRLSIAYESSFNIRFLNDYALTYWLVFTVYGRRGA